MLDKDKLTYHFTPQVLETIMDKNLTLYQYCDHLLPILKRGVTKQLIGARELETDQSDQRSSSLQQGDIEYSFPLDAIQEGLSSKQFIQKLHPYVNSLFTTTNIGIVRETLKIYMLMETNIEKFKALHRIKEAVNILTLYQVDKNVTNLVGQIDTLNSIFCKIGLIITRKQFEFYNSNIWKNIPEEEAELGHPHRGKKIFAKFLQIYDLLALAVEMEETKTLKLNLKVWMNSEQFEKYNVKRIKALKEKARLESKQLMEENMDIIRLRIQHLAPDQLLREIETRGFQIEVSQKFAIFRDELIQLLSKEDKKKEVTNVLHPKSCKIINSNLIKNKLGNGPMKNSGERLPFNRQKMEQEAFNLKVLNGFFVKKQIFDELDQGNVQFIENYFEINRIAQSDKPANQIRRVNQMKKNESKFNKKTEKEIEIVDSYSGCQTPSSTYEERRKIGVNQKQKIKQKVKGEPFFGISNLVFRK